MARVVITVQDDEDGGAVDVHAVFEPPLQREGQGTPAQQMAVIAVMGIKDTFGEDVAIRFTR